MNSPAVEGRLDRGVRPLVERLRRYVDPGWGSALRDMHDAADELERLALLLAQGLAVRVVVKGEDGWQAATYAGRDAYKSYFGTSLGGPADTIAAENIRRVAVMRPDAVGLPA